MVALAWQMYDLTGSAWDLGLVGLAQFVPALIFTLPAGQWVDRVDRRGVLAAALACQAVAAACSRSGTLRGLGRPRRDLRDVRGPGRGARAADAVVAGARARAGRRRSAAARVRGELHAAQDRGDRRPGARRIAVRVRRGGRLRDVPRVAGGVARVHRRDSARRAVDHGAARVGGDR